MVKATGCYDHEKMNAVATEVRPASPLELGHTLKGPQVSQLGAGFTTCEACNANRAGLLLIRTENQRPNGDQSCNNNLRRSTMLPTMRPTCSIGSRSCRMVSRSRMVTVPSVSVWWSTVMQKGVPMASWRR